VRCSVLDLGSNSFHVLVADLDGATLVPVEREREMLHLGRSVAQHGRLPEPDVVRAERVVAHLTALARRSGSDEHLAVATSALRDADNTAEVLARLSAAGGTRVRTLAGDEEARLAYLGVRASVAIAAEPTLVLDLGGGSLELAVGAGAEVSVAASVPLGVSRLSALVTHDPPHERDLAELHARVDDALAPLRDHVVGAAPRATVVVGGTVRALARVVAAADAVWLPTTTNQLRVPTATLERIRDRLSTIDLEARRDVPGMKTRRADHLHIAAEVLVRVLEHLGVDAVTVSDWGLREGLLLDAHGVEAPPTGSELRRAEIARLRRTFATDDRHLDHLAGLAGRLFDDLVDVHGLTTADRELLLHAVRLHDVGERVALRRHPVHGAYLVTNAELRGFAPEEIAILATLVRFHRSRGIDASHPPFAALGAVDQARTRRLLPLLQVAARCDRTRDRATRAIAVARGRDGITLQPVGSPLSVAPLELDRTADLFERIYGVPLRFTAAITTEAT
jgi:exopolyphosphatase/guanosine-5'-triphosphate,3'-diphosphate pyrophosphatase